MNTPGPLTIIGATNQGASSSAPRFGWFQPASFAAAQSSPDPDDPMLDGVSQALDSDQAADTDLLGRRGRLAALGKVVDRGVLPAERVRHPRGARLGKPAEKVVEFVGIVQ